MRTIVLMALALSAAACGGNEPAADYPKATAQAAPAKEAKPPKGALWRESVDEAVDQGLGYFLQRVDLAPSFDASGRFQGFRIVELYGDGFWDDVDLRAGDVVLRVNGKPIERENQAFEVFQGLKQAETLEVEYLRRGERRNLTYRIIPRGSVDQAAPAKQDATIKPPATGAKAPATQHS
ncbi:MAG: PDZ domain-containing protein [Polyangiaceae bacterium]